MFIEAFEVLMRGLQSRTLDFEGEFYRFKNVPLVLEPLQKPHPPLWYGVGTPENTERPARAGMNIVTNQPAHVARKLVAALLVAASRQRRGLEDRHRAPHRGRRHRRGGARDRAARLSPAGTQAS